MLYRDNGILIFAEPTAGLSRQEILELMEIMRNFTVRKEHPRNNHKASGNHDVSDRHRT